jgi:hypothetical protein
VYILSEGTTVKIPQVDLGELVCYRIPFKGSLSSPYAIRAEQASRDINFLARTELTALRQLTMAGCSSAPSLLNYRQEEQTNDIVVPQGYIFYILMNRLPGIPPGDNFWLLDAAERQDIRDALKAACEWVSLFSSMILNSFISPEKQGVPSAWYNHIGPVSGESALWDRENKKM